MNTSILDLDLREQETQKDVPFGSFFDDVFFTLLYKSSETLPNDLLMVKSMLALVSNKKEIKAKRAHAALLLGREVVSRAATKEALKPSDKRHALHWFDLAMKLNCVEAAEDCANLYLADVGQELRLGEELLPVIVKLNAKGRGGDLSPNSRAHLIWLRGARLALRHVQREFAGWEKSTFDAALNCILCFLAAEPSRGRFQIPAMVGNVH